MVEQGGGEPHYPQGLQVCSHNTSAVSLYTKLGFTTSDRGYPVLQGAIP